MPFMKAEDRINTFVPDTNPFSSDVTEKQGGGSVAETIGSSFALFNPVTALVVNDSTLSLFDEYDPSYIPEEDIVGFEEYRDILAQAKDATHMQRLKTDILRQQKHENIIAEAGGFGVASSLAASILDPIGLYSFGTALNVTKGATKLSRVTKLQKAGQIAKSSAKAAGVGAGSVALSEAALQALQPSLSAEESIKAIAGGALLGGVIGGGAKFLSLKKYKKLSVKFKKDFGSVSRTEARQAEIDDAVLKSQNTRSVGAAASPKMTAEDLELVETFGFARFSKYISPTLRVMQGNSAVAKNIFIQLAEMPLKLKGAQRGVAIPTAVESQAKLFDKDLKQAQKIKNVGYKTLRANAKASGVKPITKSEYKNRVTQAMRRNDTDVNGDPIITEVAQALRQDFFDVLKKSAIDVGLLPEDIQAKFADSYITRLWNSKSIIENEPVFREKLSVWADKTVRSQINSVKNTFSGRLQGVDNKVNKEQKSILDRENQIKEIESRDKVVLTPSSFTSVQDDFLESLKRDIGLQEVSSFVERNGLSDIAELVNRALVRVEKMPPGIVTEIIKRGGVNDVDGLLKASDITNRTRVGIINNEGLGLDVMLRDLIDDDFFPTLRGSEESILASDADIDELVDAITEDLFSGGFFRDRDISLVQEINKTQGIKDEALEALSDLEIDPKSFYKQIKEDIKKTKKSLKKEAFVERIRIKGAKKSAREAQTRTKDIRQELNKLRNKELALLKRENRKAKTRIKKLNDRRSSIEVERNNKLDAFFDVDSNDEIAQYVQDVVDEITNKLKGTHRDNSVPGFIAPVARGPLKEKLLSVEDVDFEEFFDNDIDNILSYYRHHMGTQIELTRNFGNIDLKDQIKQIQDDFSKLSANAKDAKERRKLQKEKNRTIKDIESVRDILLGRFNQADPDSIWTQASIALRDLQFMKSLGAVTLSSFPDVFRSMMINGLDNAFPKLDMAGVSKTIRKMTNEELEESSLLAEAVLSSRLQSLAEIGDPLNRGTALTRFMGNSSQVFSKFTLINYWNDMEKSAAALGTQNRILKSIRTGEDVPFLRSQGIDDLTARTILEQVKKHGQVLKGRQLTGIKNWDVDQPNVNKAKRLFNIALKKESDVAIVTAGAGDLPLIAQTPLGKVLFQFRRFIIASHSRVLLRSLQARGNKEVTGAILGAVASIAMGQVVAAMKAELASRSRGLRGKSNSNFNIASWNKRKWLLEGLDRSGLLALMLEPLNISDKAFGLGPSLLTGQGQPSRFASRNVIGSLLGPSVGTVQDIAQAGRAVASPITGAEVSSSDIYAARKLLPFQNAFIFRQIFDILEKEAGEKLGVKK